MIPLHRQALSGNGLLDRLPPHEKELLAIHSRPVEFVAGDVIGHPGARIRDVYFPRQGVLSLFSRMTDSEEVGVGMIQSDGMFGIGLSVGLKTSPLLAVSLGTGQGESIESEAFKDLLPTCPDLTQLLFAYAVTAAAQMSQNVACVAVHLARQRVARWMLDVTERDQLPHLQATQAFMATSLGLQRPAISNVAAELQRSGLIRYLRGEVTILDRPALRLVACRCSLRHRAESRG